MSCSILSSSQQHLVFSVTPLLSTFQKITPKALHANNQIHFVHNQSLTKQSCTLFVDKDTINSRWKEVVRALPTSESGGFRTISDFNHALTSLVLAYEFELALHMSLYCKKHNSETAKSIVEEAYELHLNVKKSKKKPDLYTYTAVIDGFCKVGRSNEALELLEEALEMGLTQMWLLTKYCLIVVAIKESKDLSVFSFDELMGSLQDHKTKLSRSTEKNEEKTFQAKAEEEEDSAVVEVVVMEQTNEGMIGTNCPMSKKSGKKVRITMTPNKVFSLDIFNMENFALAASVNDDSELWHLRYGHLNIKGLKLLVDKETFQKFKQFKAIVEKQSDLSIKTFRIDRDGEFLSKEFNLFCEESGIHRKLTKPYTPEQNGIAERKNRTIVAMNGTWEMVELPEEKNAIGLKWVFKSKFAMDGSLQKHKARLVAKRYAQQYGSCNNLQRFIFGVAKRVLCYIAGTMDYGIWYSQVSNFRLYGFTNSNYAGSLDDRRTAYVFTLGSSVVTWSSKKQAIATLSTLEVEYIVATSASCQAI
ncbi:putative phytosulfokine receptor 1-like [Capsicum annuum]|nr:putative phytosulfokine receptor 1-like [Capsicum annuum]